MDQIPESSLPSPGLAARFRQKEKTHSLETSKLNLSIPLHKTNHSQHPVPVLFQGVKPSLGVLQAFQELTPIFYAPAQMPPEAAQGVQHGLSPKQPQETTHGQDQTTKPLEATPEGCH